MAKRAMPSCRWASLRGSPRSSWRARSRVTSSARWPSSSVSWTSLSATANDALASAAAAERGRLLRRGLLRIDPPGLDAGCQRLRDLADGLTVGREIGGEVRLHLGEACRAVLRADRAPPPRGTCAGPGHARGRRGLGLLSSRLGVRGRRAAARRDPGGGDGDHRHDRETREDVSESTVHQEHLGGPKVARPRPLSRPERRALHFFTAPDNRRERLPAWGRTAVCTGPRAPSIGGSAASGPFDVRVGLRVELRSALAA